MRKILCKSAIPLILFYHEIEEQKIRKISQAVTTTIILTLKMLFKRDLDENSS